MTITVEEYRLLPSSVRNEFDGWMERNDLHNRLIIALTLGEGYVDVECWALDQAGRPVLDNTGENFVSEWRRFPVTSLPPREAFAS